jgi:hypothetical protein
VSLSVADSRLLVIGEYFRHYYEYIADAARTSYLLAKQSLSILRISATERYRSIASAVGTERSVLAMEVKLGQAKTFSRDDALALLRAQRAQTPEGRYLGRLLQSPPTVSDYHEYLGEMNARGGIHPWLKSLVHKNLTAATP